MVPVPEDLAEQVMKFLEYKGRVRPPARDQPTATPVDAAEAPMSRIFRGLDPGSRALLAVVSRAAVNEEKVTVAEAARRIGLSEREVLGTVLEMNHLITEQGGPPFAVLTEDAPELSSDLPLWDQRYFVTRSEIADPVLRVARDDDDGLAFLEEA